MLAASPLLIHAERLEGAFNRSLGGLAFDATDAVVVRAFGAPLNTLRISPKVMTTDEELGRFLDVISAAGA